MSNAHFTGLHHLRKVYALYVRLTKRHVYSHVGIESVPITGRLPCVMMEERLKASKSIELSDQEKEQIPCHPLRSFGDGRLKEYHCDYCGEQFKVTEI